MDDAIKDLYAEMHKATEDAMNKSFNTDNWHYRDVTWMLEHFWKQFLNILGDADYNIIACSSRDDWEGGTYLRGQFLLSPEALDNIRKYNKKGN